MTDYRLTRDGARVLELRDAPGILVSTSAPPPRPGQAPITHPFATATFYSATTEGELGAMLRAAPDLAAFLAAAREAGYGVERVGGKREERDDSDRGDDDDAESRPGAEAGGESH